MDLDNNQKNMLTNLKKAFVRTNQNSIILSNLHNELIHFDKLKISNTIKILDCENMEIIIENKINHVLIVNSRNIQITFKNELMTGLDIAHSHYIKIIYEKYHFYKIDVCFSSGIQFIIAKLITHLFIISYCMDVILISNNQVIPFISSMFQSRIFEFNTNPSQ